MPDATSTTVLLFGAGTLDSSGLFFALVTFILGGGFAAAVVAFRKAAPEAESVAVNTLRGVIEEMGKELERRDKAHRDELRQRDETIGTLKAQIDELRGQVNQLHRSKQDKPPPGHHSVTAQD